MIICYEIEAYGLPGEMIQAHAQEWYGALEQKSAKIRPGANEVIPSYSYDDPGLRRAGRDDPRTCGHSKFGIISPATAMHLETQGNHSTDNCE